MSEKTLVNPTGAFQDITDHRLYVDSSGRLLSTLEQNTADCISSAAIALGDLVRITTAASATTPPRVTTMPLAAVNTAGYLVYGVALNAATAAGQKVQVCTRGLCQVNVGAGTPADTNYAQLSTTANGQAAPVAGAPAATVVLGEYLGRFLGAKDANNRAPLFYEHM
jgi:hypothetical protein